MIRERILGEVPAGFKRVVRGRKGLILVREGLESAIDIETFTRSNGSAEPTRFEGRGRLRAVRLESGESVLIRTYRHGGLFRLVTGRWFFTWPPRPFRELVIMEQVRRRKILTVEACAACVDRVWGPFYQGWLATRELENACDLWTALESGCFRELGTAAILRAVAESLRDLHRAGIYHGDLNLKNILVRREADGLKAYLIDFDKARLFSNPVPAFMARRNLGRLRRSTRKLDPEGKRFSEEQWSLLLGFYGGTRDYAA